MVKKIIGYLLAAIGLLGIVAYSIPQVKSFVTLPPQIDDTTLIIISIIVLLVGLFFAFGNKSGRRGGEVPIYHGKNVVGYRRY